MIQAVFFRLGANPLVCEVKHKSEGGVMTNSHCVVWMANRSL